MEEKLEVEGEELKKNRIPRTIDYDLDAAFFVKIFDDDSDDDANADDKDAGQMGDHT